MVESVPSTADASPVGPTASVKANYDQISFSTKDAKNFVLSCSSDGSEAKDEQPRDLTVKISLAHNADDEHTWNIVSQSSQIQSWILDFCKTSNSILDSLLVKHVDVYSDGTFKSALIEPTLTGSVQGQSPILITAQKATVGVLVVLRASFSHSPSGSPDGPGQKGNYRGGGSRPFNRDFVLFSRMARAAVAQPNSLEIMKGYFNDEGEFECPATEELSALIGTPIHQKDLVLLSRDGPVAVAPELLVERDALYLYRQNITDEQFDKVPKSFSRDTVASKPNSQTIEQLRLTVLNEAWKITFDATSLAALFLFHEFRYHGLMPKYKAPAGVASPEKKKPSFCEVQSLRPDSVGVNLKLIVVESPLADAPLASGSSPVRDTKLVLGDCTGIIKTKVEGEHGGLVRTLEVGAKVSVRNAHVQVLSNFMWLVVDKWGKVEHLSNEEAALLKGPVDESNNRSTVEYELVPADSAAATPQDNPSAQGPTHGGGGGGRHHHRGGHRRGRGKPSAPSAQTVAV